MHQVIGRKWGYISDRAPFSTQFQLLENSTEVLFIIAYMDDGNGICSVTAQGYAEPNIAHQRNGSGIRGAPSLMLSFSFSFKRILHKIYNNMADFQVFSSDSMY